MFLELLKGGAANVESALKINVYNSSKAIWRQLRRCAKKISSRAVHDNVDLSKLIDRVCNCLFDLVSMAYVHRDRDRSATIPVDGVGSGLKVIHLPADQRDARAGFGGRVQPGSS